MSIIEQYRQKREWMNRQRTNERKSVIGRERVVPLCLFRIFCLNICFVPFFFRFCFSVDWTQSISNSCNLYLYLFFDRFNTYSVMFLYFSFWNWQIYLHPSLIINAIHRMNQKKRNRSCHYFHQRKTNLFFLSFGSLPSSSLYMYHIYGVTFLVAHNDRIVNVIVIVVNINKQQFDPLQIPSTIHKFRFILMNMWWNKASNDFQCFFSPLLLSLLFERNGRLFFSVRSLF